MEETNLLKRRREILAFYTFSQDWCNLKKKPETMKKLQKHKNFSFVICTRWRNENFTMENYFN